MDLVRDAGHVIELDAAVRIVEEELEREFRREAALGVRPHDLVRPAPPVRP
ncbi:hypothetical protein ACFV19_15200 [Streptomyces griseoluteus]|uniref:hypothetical protein n=1 Tax=Streptomyces griseoluteus TaxID=29306 RepID=UPI003674D00A